MPKKSKNSFQKDVENRKIEKKSGKKKKIGFALIFLALVLLIIILILLLQLKILDLKLPSKTKLFLIEDECSLIVGQLIHTINDEEICEMKCKTECEVRKIEFYSSEFTMRENDCSECKCFCR